jgi:hypothetical protein
VVHYLYTVREAILEKDRTGWSTSVGKDRAWDAFKGPNRLTAIGIQIASILIVVVKNGALEIRVPKTDQARQICKCKKWNFYCISRSHRKNLPCGAIGAGQLQALKPGFHK